MPKMMKLKLLDARGNSRNAVPVSHGLALVTIPEMRLLQDPIAAIWRFLENASLGDTFFQAPSEELLIQVIFKPETVTRKAWVVYVNYMLLAMLSDDKNPQAQNFRQNMKLALNDSSIFLEPNEAHLQALILLAIHGEDYSSPGSSWMLVGHACRQAQALELHNSTNVEYETRQRRLSLFWLLFAVDKSCSLAFGRPCFLPSDTYSHIPLPDLSYLMRFKPRSDIPETVERKRQKSMFGAHMFLARMELARLTGDSYALSNNELMAEARGLLRTKLVEWHTRTIKALQDILDNERSLSSPGQLHEMSLGISTIKFEYLHTLMAFTNGDPSSSNLRLEAAREAISLLPSMVSNWTLLFNSMIWKHHASLSTKTIQQDADLLANTVSYYASMRGQMRLLAPLCARLENVANVFLRLVQHELNSRGTLKKAGIFPQGAMQSLSTQEPTGGKADSLVIPINEMRRELGDGISADLEQYLEWLPTDMLQTHSVISQEIRNSVSDTEPVYESPPLNQGSRGTKRPFDVMFDWFAWDVYYADNK
ncbi:fungal-specific transcription factor domain-containing protein [Fusarium acuminatum]|uniref:Fungal-specific transcription factor domain-containing protein n=1 Tax=Fusarium acuminatum TaxID=5515 RepID=A0ABZ2WXK2_9HYPO